jgi:hypothetical protein
VTLKFKRLETESTRLTGTNVFEPLVVPGVGEPAVELALMQMVDGMKRAQHNCEQLGIAFKDFAEALGRLTLQLNEVQRTIRKEQETSPFYRPRLIRLEEE